MMNLVKCDICGKEITIIQEVLLFDQFGVDIMGICQECDYEMHDTTPFLLWDGEPEEDAEGQECIDEWTKMVEQECAGDNHHTSREDAYDIAYREGRGDEIGIPGVDHECSDHDWIFED
jgi:hypothetical protein